MTDLSRASLVLLADKDMEGRKGAVVADSPFKFMAAPSSVAATSLAIIEAGISSPEASGGAKCTMSNLFVLGSHSMSQDSLAAVMQKACANTLEQCVTPPCLEECLKLSAYVSDAGLQEDQFLKLQDRACVPVHREHVVRALCTVPAILAAFADNLHLQSTVMSTVANAAIIMNEHPAHDVASIMLDACEACCKALWTCLAMFPGGLKQACESATFEQLLLPCMFMLSNVSASR